MKIFQLFVLFLVLWFCSTLNAQQLDVSINDTAGTRGYFGGPLDHHVVDVTVSDLKEDCTESLIVVRVYVRGITTGLDENGLPVYQWNHIGGEHRGMYYDEFTDIYNPVEDINHVFEYDVLPPGSEAVGWEVTGVPDYYVDGDAAGNDFVIYTIRIDAEQFCRTWNENTLLWEEETLYGSTIGWVEINIGQGQSGGGGSTGGGGQSGSGG